MYFFSLAHTTANACHGDSGSPLMSLTTDTGRPDPYYDVSFIVSSGVDTTCNFEATLYVRVEDRKILTWVQKETDQTPLLMVVGGFSSKVSCQATLLRVFFFFTFSFLFLRFRTASSVTSS